MIIHETDKHKAETSGTVRTAPTTKLIATKDILQLFPDAAYAELKGYSYNSDNPIDDRGTAFKILDILKGGEPIDGMSDSFNGFMSWAVINLSSFSQDDSDNIKRVLGL